MAADPSGPPATILIVDDLPTNVEVLRRMLLQDGYRVCTAASADEAIGVVEREHPDVVLMDVMMPERSGYDACREMKERLETRLTPVVLVTALQDRESRIRGIESGADDFLTKPVDRHELRARVRSLVRLKRYTDELDSAEAVIVSLALTIEARDHYTKGHCQRLAAYSEALGRRIGLLADDLLALRRGGFLHDVGKIAVPDAILLKPGRLDAAEYETIKEHAVVGDRLCGQLRALRKVRGIVRHHHERLDGSGYPDALTGGTVPLLAQIMGIVDVFDALTTDRPYQRARPASVACTELTTEAARGWRDASLVTSFVELVRRGEFDGLGAAARAGAARS
jgi:putative two-component system response regulator